MAQTSLRDILPLAAGLGATAMLSFALGGLTTYWALHDQPTRTAMIEPAPAVVQAPAVSLVIPAALVAQPDPAPEPLPPPVPEPLQVEVPPPPEPPVRVVEAPPPQPQPKPQPVFAAKAETEPKPPRPPSSGFAVQVGAYLEADNARHMARQLAAQGVKARVVSWTDRSGRLWYATRVGSHDAPVDAQQEAAELSRHGFQTLVVRKVSGETS